jgi:hypothetical protein
MDETEEINSSLTTAAIIVLSAVLFIGLVVGFGCAALIFGP